MKNKFNLQSTIRSDDTECWWITTENNVSSEIFYNKDDALRHLKRCQSLEKAFKVEEYFYPPHMKKPCFRISLEDSFIVNFISWFKELGGEDHNKEELKYFSSFSLYGRYFRVLPCSNMIQMSDANFDRWANSVEETSIIPLNKDDFIDCMSDFKTKLTTTATKDALIDTMLDDFENVDYSVLSELFESLTTNQIDHKKKRLIYDIEELLRDLTLPEIEQFSVLVVDKKAAFSI
jgi:hypothetical protein